MLQSWCKALTDKNKDLVDTNNTAGGDDVEQYLGISMAYYILAPHFISL
jgi:hypothetical protein